MKRTIIIILLAALCVNALAANAATGEKNGFGLGIIVGEPTGISARFHNFAFALSWSFHHRIQFHCDYWVHNARVWKDLKWYVGAGGRIGGYADNKNKDNDNVALGFRIPLGLQYYVVPAVELFGEIVPGISLLPSTSFAIEGGIGARFFFF